MQDEIPGVSDKSLLSLVNTPTREALFEQITERWRNGRGFSIATLNLDHLVKLQNEPTFRAAYDRHSHVVADGNPIVWLHRVKGQPVQLVPGSELVEPIARLAAELDMPVAMLGATSDTLERAAERLEADYPGLKVVLKSAPPFGFDPAGDAAADELRKVSNSGARLCFIALGAPKQEILAVRGAEFAPNCGFISVGAGLDFIAGTQQRAPKWARRIAMEWMWRLAMNPARLAKRYALCIAILPGLFWAALRARNDTNS